MQILFYQFQIVLPLLNALKLKKMKNALTNKALHFKHNN
jgi:hypothetical protein